MEKEEHVVPNISHPVSRGRDRQSELPAVVNTFQDVREFDEVDSAKDDVGQVGFGHDYWQRRNRGDESGRGTFSRDLFIWLNMNLGFGVFCYSDPSMLTDTVGFIDREYFNPLLGSSQSVLGPSNLEAEESQQSVPFLTETFIRCWIRRE